MIDSSTRRIVCDTGPLISLEKLNGGYLFIRRLFERQAIALAIQLELPLLIEEEAGRMVARDLGIEISGIAGQLLRAARQDFATSEEALVHLTRLRERGRINRQVFAAVRDAIEDEV